ncbi:phenylacetate--CoA ligase family protein [Streptomyces purpurascens]|uniref:Phenylacetate--CoA ligase family protein n=1 Tax=Streptomyces purpurascens TaxID=1924 RepID=A0ABZ1MG07_STREF|nr:phenylacetate--CoA ligase family protein [Streptomyces purpurascens]MCE7048353.1 phenylacetate--CoA ligase family protein [Streptomyces purpurascens]
MSEVRVILHTDKRQTILREAQDEIRENQGRIPAEYFYTEKLSAAWQRARGTRAYGAGESRADIGEFSLDRFRDLPVTPRESLKARPLDFAAVSPTEASKYYETTGTTGQPTPTPRRAEDTIWNTVSVAEAWRPLLGSDERVVILLPSDIVPVADLVAGVCEYLDHAHIRAYPFATGISDWDRLESMWRTYRPTTVFVAPGVALQFTRLLAQRGQLDELNSSVERLMLLGEVNTAPFRARLGRWWNADVYDASYGSTETGTLAAACAHGRQHLLPAATYFELATPEGVVPLHDRGGHEQGRLVVTPLNAHARPLLRLDTGDEVSVEADCPCGSAAPGITVHGRSSDGLRVRGTPLSVRAVEEVVYGVTDATGYLLEVDSEGTYARLLLERGIGAGRDGEPEECRRVQARSEELLGLRWDGVVFVNSLPANTKSGASQKSWKRSNIREVEVAR